MAHRIAEAEKNGIAWQAGLREGDRIETINGEEIIDEIDYQALTSLSTLVICGQKKDGKNFRCRIEKEDWEPLGLRMDDSLLCRPMLCRNKCVFCFVDQMRPGLRDTLYVRDDDWRMSLMMGNFVTLTNLSDAEFDRILRRHASPLYISVHTTNMALRLKMMKNPNAAKLTEQLHRLMDGGIRFHCQVVLCPGWNDGAELDRTLADLSDFGEAMLSVALVPVGLTRYREKLPDLKPYDADGAKEVIAQCDRARGKNLARFGSAKVYAADEFYAICGLEAPPEDYYEGYPQIENGVGMLRRFEEELREAAEGNAEKAVPRRVTIACGVSAAPFMRRMLRRWCPEGVTAKVHPIVNHFFGETVTVTGLLTGQDLTEQLKDEDTDEILISGGILGMTGEKTLDDVSAEDLRRQLPAPVTFTGPGGADFLQALLGRP